MSVVDQQRADPIPTDTNWRRPAWICVSLAILGGLLGGAIWLQSHGAMAPPQAHGYPRLPTVPLKIGFYDLSGRRVVETDPVWSRFAALHLDYLLLQGVAEEDETAAARLAGMTGADVHIASKSFGGGVSNTQNAVDCIIARHSLSDVELLSAGGEPFGVWAESQIGDRVIRLASLSASVPSRKTGVHDLPDRWEGLAKGDQPLPPIVIGLGDGNVWAEGDLVRQKTGWFDAAAAFWNSPLAPAPGHLLFSSGWSCTAGQAITDPHDAQHRTGWVVSTAGAASPATHPAGVGDD